eukprot:GAHX01000030.1.p1 GENE.GAHX01000030.1~~GAHX01000030.1.p1  ORF type:complete len:259 (+),score=45.47 GAHX01000030.1:54-779(+)
MPRSRRQNRRVASMAKLDLNDRFVKLCKKMKEYHDSTNSRTLFIVRPKTGTPFIYTTGDISEVIKDYKTYSGPGRRIGDEDNDFLQAGNSIGRKVGVSFAKRSTNIGPIFTPQNTPSASPANTSDAHPTTTSDDSNINLPQPSTQSTTNNNDNKDENKDLNTALSVGPLYNNSHNDKINDAGDEINESEESEWKESNDDKEFDGVIDDESEEYEYRGRKGRKKYGGRIAKRPTTRSRSSKK